MAGYHNFKLKPLHLKLSTQSRYNRMALIFLYLVDRTVDQSQTALPDLSVSHV